MTTRQRAVIVSAVRTPMGSFNGGFSSLPSTKLGSLAIADAVNFGDWSSARMWALAIAVAVLWRFIFSRNGLVMLPSAMAIARWPSGM